MIKDKIIGYCNSLGLDTLGFIPCRRFEELVEFYKYRKENNLENEFEEKEIEKRINPKVYMEDGKTIISIAFPYYHEDVNENNNGFSIYTKRGDYHRVVKEYLEKICIYINSLGWEAISFVDSNYLPERYIAYLAGVGFIGRNNMIITEKYGSYVFLGEIITNAPIVCNEVRSIQDILKFDECNQCDICIKECPTKVEYIIVNEAGASVYSASKLATEEFPDFDVAQRSAVSIARRVQDPLAELVKIDPKSIGVGQYQHDMNQKKLSETLTGVVEDSVNKVGVDLNTASASLLEYISGISKAVAKNIVDYRETNGRFTNRKQLLKVAKLGPKAFEQCAGFMRISGGDNPLDATSVHPESYDAAAKLLEILGYNINSISSGELIGLGKKISNLHEMAEKVGIGEITLEDIVKELEKPGRDPREEMVKQRGKNPC